MASRTERITAGGSLCWKRCWIFDLLIVAVVWKSIFTTVVKSSKPVILD